MKVRRFFKLLHRISAAAALWLAPPTLPAGADNLPAGIFADVPDTHPFRVFIERLYELSITSGCATNPLRFCPDEPVTRAQMAKFLLRSAYGPTYSPPPATGTRFGDVPLSHPFARWIEQLATENITSGCAIDPPRFCPDAPVTRAHMAKFLLRAKYGPAFGPPTVNSPTFADVPLSHPFVRWIEQLARERITTGCSANPPLYCPEEPVTRGQMAVFLGRTFSLLSASCRWPQLPRIYSPGFGANPIAFAQTAVAWFGHLSEDSNWADLRVGYNNNELYVYTAIYDRHLWYDANPTPPTLTQWDAVTLLLDTNGAGPSHPTAWRFTAQLYGEPSPPRRAVWRGSPTGWQPASVPFGALPGWRGNALNDNSDSDRGWAMGFTIPFASLGLSSPPSPGSTWRMAVIVHDRDTLAGPPFADQIWPPGASASSLNCWGQLRFGLPTWQEPRPVAGSVTIRRLTSSSPLVPDADVGGSTGNQCPGDEFHIWNQWGNLNWGFRGDFNIQNQSDVADWPCFARYYVTFPLTSVPTGKRIVSATLTLHQFGNSGGPSAPSSWIQVLTTAADWSESAITWNNAPLAHANVGGAWVDAIEVFPGWPGVPRTWDVSWAVAQAYHLGQPLRLVLYSADSDYHTGKYFVSSDTGDWNTPGRPTLLVRWANPP